MEALTPSERRIAELDRSLGVGELTSAARRSLRGQAGARGANGVNGTNGLPGLKGGTGDQGGKGDKGDRGPSNAFNTPVPSPYVIDGAFDSRDIITGYLDPGLYVMTAKFVVKNTGPDPQRPNCQLGKLIGDDQLFLSLDQVEIGISNTSPNNENVITLTAATEILTQGTPYLVRCEPFGDAPYTLTFRDRSLIAVQVATLTSAT